MSRAQASKSRQDKGRGGQSIPTPAISHEIIPGKFTELDWNAALDIDDSEDLASQIVANVVENAMVDIYQVYLKRQLVPFTVALAKDAMLQIVEWQFLAHDTGEDDILENSTWQEDDEPNSCVVDSWAQGAIPKRPAPLPTPRPISEEVQDVEMNEDKVEDSEESVKMEETGESESPPIEMLETVESAEIADTTMVPTPPTSGKPKRDVFIPGWSKRAGPVKYRPYKGRIKSPGLNQLTESLYETELRMQRELAIANMMAEMSIPEGSSDNSGFQEMLKNSSSTIRKNASQYDGSEVQAGRPPGNKDIEYDDSGNIVSVQRIPSEQLPQHRIKVGYRVVDPAVEAANARLEAMKKGRRFADDQIKKNDKTKADKSSLQTENIKIQPTNKVDERLSDPLPPSMIDTIILAPGVAVKEGDRMKRGQKPVNGAANIEKMMKDLKPVRQRFCDETVDISDLIDSSRIAIKPLGNSKPIPPIASS